MAYRYDIRPTPTGEWEIIDTGNRYAPTGEVFPTRAEALTAVRQKEGK